MNNQKLVNGLKNIYVILKIFRTAKEDNGQIFVDELNKIDRSLLDKQIEYYGEDTEKVKKIRVDILKKLKIGNISLDDVEKIKEKEKKNYDYNILKSWTNFSILCAVFYFYHKETLNTFFMELNQNLIKDLGIEDSVNIKIIGFDGAQNFGLDGFWTAIYNNSHKSQKTALQLNIASFRKNYENLGLNEIGIGVGHGPEYHGEVESTEEIFDLKELTYEKILKEFEKYKNLILQDIYTESLESTNDVHYRLYAPGENARKWDEYYESGYMGIGWDEMGDISKYKDRESLKKHYIDVYGKDENNNILACYEFAHVLKIGDIVIPKKGRKTYLGYGIVESDYIYDDTLEEYKSVRKVKWMKKGEWYEDGDIVLKTLTDLTKTDSKIVSKTDIIAYAAYVEKLKKLLGITGFTPSTINNMKQYNHLNTILYGAPGTGKTYNTINYALSIIENKSLAEINKEDRTGLKERFDSYKEQGQIVFCTFHQSLSYEEFIEGIKASSDDGTISYDIGDGIFKGISNKAEENYNNSKGIDINLTELLNNFGDYVRTVIEEGEIFKINDSVTINNINYDSLGNMRSFTLGGTVNGQMLGKQIIERDYQNFKKGLIKDFSYIKPRHESQSLSHGNARYYFQLMQKIKEFEKSNEIQKKEMNQTLKNYVLIIDEINRGNMSKIFGELITLLEPSKRIGAEEELKVRLPYSQDEFGVPQNLYVIGTMNTADRSIALIDIALRRRFTFKEIEPNSGLLTFKVGNIDIQKMFEKINQRIEFLYDRDHKLGHSFFMDLKENNSLTKLNEIFCNNIIPLLQEYFYEDWEKIQIVLGDHNNQKTKVWNDKIIQEINLKEKDVIGFDHDDLEDKMAYIINENLNENSYLGIYENKKSDVE